MGFQIKNFTPIGGQARSGSAPATWSYQSMADGLLAVQAPDYFNEIGTQVQPGDFIYTSLMDGRRILTVGATQLSPPRVVINSQTIGFDDFNPADIVGLIEWLDAGDTSTIEESGGVGTGVSKWIDKSGNGNDVVQAVMTIRPLTGANTLNGRNVVTFTGINTFLEKLSFAVSANLTIFIVAKVISTSSEFESILSLDAVDNDFQIDAAVSGSFAAQMRSDNLGSTTMPLHPTDLLGIPSLINYRLSDNDEMVVLRVNGAQSASDTYDGGLASPQNLYLAQNRGENFWLNVDMAEVLIYNTDLTLADMMSLENYLSEKWGIMIAF